MKDVARARSLVEQSELDYEGLADISINERTAAHLLRGIYELVRMLGKALLVAKGVKTLDDHKESITVLVALPVKTQRPLALLEELRLKRHRVHYFGHKVSVAEAQDYLDMVREIYPVLLEKVKQELRIN